MLGSSVCLALSLDFQLSSDLSGARRTAVGGCGPRESRFIAQGGALMSTKPSIVFAHGLWADGSCFTKVIKLLQADGYEVIATQNQLNTVEDDAAAVRTALGRVISPSVLVGHSYGGTVITAAGTDDRVKALVYH